MTFSVTPLAESAAESCKARGLALLSEAGLAIPPTWLIRPNAASREVATHALEALVESLTVRQWIVRPAPIGSSSQDLSSVFDSKRVMSSEVIDVVEAAISVSGLWIQEDRLHGAIKRFEYLLQPFIEPEYSGIAHVGRWPSAPLDEYVVRVAWVEGHLAGLATGSESGIEVFICRSRPFPNECSIIGRNAGVRTSSVRCSRELKSLHDCIVPLAIAHGPLEIEWAFATGTIWYLQADPMTAADIVTWITQEGS